MLVDAPPIVDAIIELTEFALSRTYAQASTRQSIARRIETLHSVEGASEILANTDENIRASLISDIGYGIEPSNLIAVLDLLDRVGVPWDTFKTWTDAGDNEKIFHKETSNHLNINYSSVILDFHHHQYVMSNYNIRSNKLKAPFIYLFFTAFGHDTAADILAHWNTNSTTAMLIDLIRLADNWDQFKNYPSDWALSVLGITVPAVAKVK